MHKATVYPWQFTQNYCTPRRFVVESSRQKGCVSLLFIGGLNESVYNNMRVYSGELPRSTPTKLARYADTLFNIADRSVRSLGKSLKYRTAIVSSWPHKLFSYAVEIYRTTRTSAMLAPGLYDNSRRTTTLPASNEILYCKVCLEKTSTLIQRLYVKAPGDLLQKREKDFMKLRENAKSSQLYYRCGRETSRGGIEYNRT